MSKGEVNDFSKILEDLNEIKEEEAREWKEDIIKKTVSSLLSVEKEALYSSLKAKNKKIDEIISKAIEIN